MDGFFNIIKEKGYTSFDVCNKIKYKFKEKKVGHTGTLDPNATGVMQIAVGKATKLLPLLEDHQKVYEATIRFGILTDTLDPEGKVINIEIPSNLSIDLINEKLKEVSQRDTQIPPIYSAIKVNGKKLYEYARNNEEVKLEPRPCKVYESFLTSNIYIDEGYPTIKVKMKVSKGFYVRSFVRDLAEELGTIATMQDLVRLQTGKFKIENSKTLDSVDENDLVTIEEVFEEYPSFNAKEYLVKLIKNGVELDERQIVTDKPFKVYYDNKLIAIYAPKGNNKYGIVQYFGD